MRRAYLGDAIDFWKGAFLRVLRETSMPERHVTVVPMFPDADGSTAELATYTTILGVRPSALLSTSQFTSTGRHAYFAAYAKRSDDVFVDLDVGVAPSKPKVSHVTSKEVLALLSTDNVVAVYQHRPHRIGGRWLTRYAQILEVAGPTATAYESAQVGMLFVTGVLLGEPICASGSWLV